MLLGTKPMLFATESMPLAPSRAAIGRVSFHVLWRIGRACGRAIPAAGFLTLLVRERQAVALDGLFVPPVDRHDGHSLHEQAEEDDADQGDQRVAWSDPFFHGADATV